MHQQQQQPGQPNMSKQTFSQREMELFAHQAHLTAHRQQHDLQQQRWAQTAETMLQQPPEQTTRQEASAPKRSWQVPAGQTAYQNPNTPQGGNENQEARMTLQEQTRVMHTQYQQGADVKDEVRHQDEPDQAEHTAQAAPADHLTARPKAAQAAPAQAAQAAPAEHPQLQEAQRLQQPGVVEAYQQQQAETAQAQATAQTQPAVVYTPQQLAAVEAAYKEWHENNAKAQEKARKQQLALAQVLSGMQENADYHLAQQLQQQYIQENKRERALQQQQREQEHAWAQRQQQQALAEQEQLQQQALTEQQQQALEEQQQQALAEQQQLQQQALAEQQQQALEEQRQQALAEQQQQALEEQRQQALAEQQQQALAEQQQQALAEQQQQALEEQQQQALAEQQQQAFAEQQQQASAEQQQQAWAEQQQQQGLAQKHAAPPAAQAPEDAAMTPAVPQPSEAANEKSEEQLRELGANFFQAAMMEPDGPVRQFAQALMERSHGKIDEITNLREALKKSEEEKNQLKAMQQGQQTPTQPAADPQDPQPMQSPVDTHEKRPSTGHTMMTPATCKQFIIYVLLIYHISFMDLFDIHFYAFISVTCFNLFCHVFHLVFMTRVCKIQKLRTRSAPSKQLHLQHSRSNLYLWGELIIYLHTMIGPADLIYLKSANHVWWQPANVWWHLANPNLWCLQASPWLVANLNVGRWVLPPRDLRWPVANLWWCLAKLWCLAMRWWLLAMRWWLLAKRWWLLAKRWWLLLAKRWWLHMGWHLLWRVHRWWGLHQKLHQQQQHLCMEPTLQFHQCRLSPKMNQQPVFV